MPVALPNGYLGPAGPRVAMPRRMSGVPYSAFTAFAAFTSFTSANRMPAARSRV
jgi:hypothetical protein